MLKTTFIILNWRERRSGGNEDDEKWEKEENWMLLYSVHSSRSFLLEGEHSIEALEKNWCVCVCVWWWWWSSSTTSATSFSTWLFSQVENLAFYSNQKGTWDQADSASNAAKSRDVGGGGSSSSDKLKMSAQMRNRKCDMSCC